MRTRVYLRAGLQVATIMGLAVLGSSCSTVAEKHATYLQSTAQLQPEKGNEKKIRAYRNSEPATAFRGYQVDRVAFIAPDMKLDGKQKQVLVDRLTTDLQHNFASAAPGNPRGKTVQIRGAITAADKANVWVNLLADAVLNFPVSMGGVAVELEATSQPDGQRVAAAQYFMPGRPWQLIASHSETGQARAGVDKAAAHFYTLVTGQKAPPAAKKSSSRPTPSAAPNAAPPPAPETPTLAVVR
jgi:hypothetical protein